MGTQYDAAAVPDGQVGSMRLANAFHMGMGVVLVAVGIWILLLSGNTLKVEGTSPAMVRELATALVLLVFGVGNVRASIAHWSYRFTPETISLPGADPSDTDKAKAYIDGLIANGIRPAASDGTAVSGLVDAIAPNIGMAQPVVRAHAFRQIQRTIYLLVLLCSFLVAWFMADAAVFPLVAVVYFLIAMVIVRPLDVLKRNGTTPDQSILEKIPMPTPGKSILLLVVAVIAPAALSYGAGKMELPAELAQIHGFGVPTLVILLPALAGSVLFFLALARQTADLATSKAIEWGVLEDYAVPDLGDGLLIRLRSEVPEPRTRLRESFSCTETKWQGGFLYETAPELVRGQDTRTLAGAMRAGLASKLTRPLVWLELLGVALGLAACLFAFRYATSSGMQLAAMACGLLASSQYCMGAAHKLWKRADFRSRIYDVFIWSNIQRDGGTRGNSKSGGGVFEDNSHTVLSGAIQVRVLEMRSVQFTPGGPRFATALDLHADASRATADSAAPYAKQVLERRAASKAQKIAELDAFTPTVKVHSVGQPVLGSGATSPLLEDES